jgi:aminoglycoside phosphotransferase (APT) family kinase protein
VREWDAEVVVDVGLARRLLAQFPELRVDSLRLVAEGWDATVWLVDEKWAFRFPRRTIAIPGFERELALLPELAPLLPLPIPRPALVGRPADGYPWPFWGGAFLPGREVSEAELDDAARLRLGLELASFLKRLHSREVAAAIGSDRLPVDPNRRGDMTFRVRVAREQLAQLEQLGLWRAPPAVVRLLEQAEQLPAVEPVAVVHGDLHFRHLLVGENGRAAGVIDWGDLCRADPAIDLPLVWSFLPPSGRGAFLEAYGPVSEEQLVRARVLAVFLCAVLARYGHERGPATVEREALSGLERAATE